MSFLTFSYINVIGILLLLLYILQLLSGILLTIYYNYYITISFDSIYIVVFLINNGWMIRILHVIGASIFILLIMLHLIRYNWIKSRIIIISFIWMGIIISGYLLYILCNIEGFIGYLLLWGQMSYWGIIIMINIISILPCIGKVIAELIWSAAWIILNRIFIYHILIGNLIGLIIMLHLILLHSFSSYNMFINNNSMVISFYPIVIKDLYSVIIILGYMISVYINFEPDIIGNSDNQVIANPIITPNNILPEWYFLLYYCSLRSFSNKIIGLLIIINIILVLFI